MATTLLNSEYIFTKDYTDKSNRNCKATIKLIVDYASGTFSVLPYNIGKKEFGFISSSKHNIEMWKAVIQLIDEAMTYGESLLNPPVTIDDVISNINVIE
jgi:hypothetical protein